MKTNKYIAVSLCILSLSMSSCEDYLDVNENPNEALDAPIENVMTSAMVSLMAGHSGEDARLAGMWTQQFTGVDRQYAAFDVYNTTSGDYDWGKYYYGVIEQCKVIIDKEAVTSNKINLGIAKTLQAHSYGMIASLYGDVPFSEANQFPAIENPKFDGQVSVYAGVQTLLDEAIVDLNNAGGAIAAADLFYNGDNTKWLELAYTLKARFYMHTKQYTLAAAAAANGISSTANNWLTSHGTSYNQDLNMYNSFIVSDREGYMVGEGSYLSALIDPNNTANYRGNAKTVETERYNDIFFYDSTNAVLNLNPNGMWSATSPFPLATAIENHLILAELNARNGADGAAIGNLNDVRAILRGRYPTGTYDDYIIADFLVGGIEDNGQGTANLNLLYEIMEEKYVSLVGQIEAFNDVRRTNNFLGLTPKGSNSSLPQRFIYPLDELNSNTSAPAAVGVFVKTEVNQ